ncbi:MAG: DUF1549 domain-containing protein [Pirellulales bacterium]
MDQEPDPQHRPPGGCPEEWLEGALAEALGQQGPPDLSQQILEALAHGRKVDVAPAVDRGPVRRRRSRRRNYQLLVWWASALTLMFAASLSLRWILDHPVSDQGVAKDPQDPPRPKPGLDRPGGSGGTGLAGKSTDSNEAVPPWEHPDQRLAPSTNPDVRTVPRTSPDQVAQRIDQHFQTLWTSSGKSVDSEVTDDQWLRRVWWSLFGTVPTAAEESEWLITLASTSRAETLDRLMAAPRSQMWQQHWGRLLARGWLNLPGESDQVDPVQDHQRLAEYCHERLQAGDGLDDIAQRLVTATGSSNPSAGDYSPAVAYWQGTKSEDPGVVVDRICRGMLGTRLDCARCHDHPVGAYTQSQYWQLRAYLQLVRIDGQADGHRRVFDQPPDGRTGARKSNDKTAVHVTSAENKSAENKSTENKSAADSLGVYYQRTDSTMGIALPQWPLDVQEAGSSDPESMARLRQEMARRMVRSRSFARAMANRIWSGVVGVGLVSPIDDLGPHVRSPHLPLLDQLTDELIAQEFELAAAVKWVLLSQPLRVEGAETPMTQHEVVLFERFPLRPMQLRSTPATLSLFASMSGGAVTLEEIIRKESIVLAQFQPSGRAANGMDPQAVEVPPSQVAEWLTSMAAHPELDEADEALVVRLTAKELESEQLVDHAFLALLRRLPSAGERRDAQQILAGKSSRDGLRRIWKALRTAAEAGDYR